MSVRRNKARFLIASLCFSVASGVLAQDVDTDKRLLACDAIENQQDRLACFNSVVESIRGGSPVPDVQAPPAEPPPATASVPAVDPAPTAAQAPTPVAKPLPSPQPIPAAEAPAAAPSPAPATSVERAPSVPEVAAPRARAPEPVAAVKTDGDLTGSGIIVRVWEQLDGRFTVKLNNGQYWRETEGTRVGIPDVGSGVTITRGFLSGYRMKIDGVRRVAWVRPTD